MTGMTGERGDRGERGVTGERGAKGDHGQDGERGKTGATGEASPYLGRRQTLVLFAFVVLAFLTLAVRSETQARTIQDNTVKIQQAVYEVCIAKADVNNVKSDCERFR